MTASKFLLIVLALGCSLTTSSRQTESNPHQCAISIPQDIVDRKNKLAAIIHIVCRHHKSPNFNNPATCLILFGAKANTDIYLEDLKLLEQLINNKPFNHQVCNAISSL